MVIYTRLTMTVLTEHDCAPRFLETISEMELPQLCKMTMQLVREIQRHSIYSHDYRCRRADLIALGLQLNRMAQPD
jgi:hypothetical protein